MPDFGNDFETEALPGALPQGMNSPQKCNYGLYGKVLSGTAFTSPSHQNERTWCYRIRPSVQHTHRFRKIAMPLWKSAPCIDSDIISLGQYRWDPLQEPDEPLTWITGMRTMVTADDVNTQTGMASHVYLVTESMKDAYFYSADSEMLVVPQEGRLRFCTELGVIDLELKEIAILPRGLVYRVEEPSPSNGAGSFMKHPSPTALWMWWPGMATMRPANTTCAPVVRWGRCCSTTPTPASSPC